MSRHIAVFCMTIITFTTPLGCPLFEELHSAEKAALDKSEQEKFCVTVWAKATRVQIGGNFDVTWRVVNATEKPQSVRLRSAMWDRHWKSSNARIVPTGGIIINATRDYIKTIKLEPGEAYEKHVQMAVEDGPPLVTTSFQMGFTPSGEKKTYWSNKVVLGIKPTKRK